MNFLNARDVPFLSIIYRLAGWFAIVYMCDRLFLVQIRDPSANTRYTHVCVYTYFEICHFERHWQRYFCLSARVYRMHIILYLRLLGRTAQPDFFFFKIETYGKF